MKKGTHMVEYIFDNDRPIYMQLVEKIRIEIVSGKLQSGERLPSVRELALIAKVNPNTMQKALTELETQGLVYTERTNGKFVTKDQEKIEMLQKELAKQKVEHFLEDMKHIGIPYAQAITYLQELGGK